MHYRLPANPAGLGLIANSFGAADHSLDQIPEPTPREVLEELIAAYREDIAIDPVNGGLLIAAGSNFPDAAQAILDELDQTKAQLANLRAQNN